MTDVPSSETAIQLSLGEATDEKMFQECRDAIVELLPAFRPGKAVRISGGITNCLVRVDVEAGAVSEPCCSILVRMFGEVGSKFSDRKYENDVAIKLASQHLGPDIYGTGDNFRLEGWMADRKPLSSDECLEDDKIVLIAQKLYDFHHADIMLRDPSMKIDTDEFWFQLKKTIKLVNECEGIDWIDVKAIEAELDWFKTLVPSGVPASKIAQYELGSLKGSSGSSSGYSSRSVLQKVKNLFNGNNKTTGKAIPARQRAAQEFLFEVGFVHFDLLGGNLMYSKDKNDIMIIDFDYVAHAPIGVDIGNHFQAICETKLIDTGKMDMKQLPTKEQQTLFVKSYLLRGKERGRNFDAALGAIDECLNIVALFSMLTTMRWTLWGIIQSTVPGVDFDYKNYCLECWDVAYKHHKKIYLETVPASAA